VYFDASQVQRQTSKAPAPSAWSRHMEESMPPMDIQVDLVRRCLGLPCLDPASADDGTSSRLPICGVTGMPVGLPAGFLFEPRLIQTISCKWKKDRKPCGITDIALTDDGRVFVADSLNKAVKIYDSLQVNITSQILTW